MSRQILSLTDEPRVALAAAEAAVTAGGCIVIPTDTVYGIGADAFNTTAVEALLAAKRRGKDMPVPVLIGDPEMIDALAQDVPSGARELAAGLWPGALTLIVTARAGLALDVGETGGTIAIRVPDHDDVRQLLRRTGPLAVSSANTSGEQPATTCESAVEQLGFSVAVYVDGGVTPGLSPSTIVDFHTSPDGIVVRPGRLSLEALREHCPTVRLAYG